MHFIVAACSITIICTYVNRLIVLIISGLGHILHRFGNLKVATFPLPLMNLQCDGRTDGPAK